MMSPSYAASAKIPFPKPYTHVGSCPTEMKGHAIQEAKSKQVVVQSNTILRYIGRRTGLLPESPLALAKLEAIMDFMVAGLALDTPFFLVLLEHLATTGTESRSSNSGGLDPLSPNRTYAKSSRHNAQAMDVEPLALCSHLQAP